MQTKQFNLTNRPSIRPLHRILMVVALLILAVVSGKLLGGGLKATAPLAYEAIQIANSHRWPSAPCIVVSNALREYRGRRRLHGSRFLEVWVRYEIESQTYMTNQWVRPDPARGGIENLQQRYAVGARSECFVNPTAPHRAVLQHESLWNGLIAIPFLLFAAGTGCVGILVVRGFVYAVRKTRK